MIIINRDAVDVQDAGTAEKFAGWLGGQGWKCKIVEARMIHDDALLEAHNQLWSDWCNGRVATPWAVQASQE